MRQALVTYKDWMDLHPWQDKANDEVIYYVKLANKLADTLRKNGFKPSVAIQASCGLAAYLEDIVSGGLLFSSVRSLFINKYGDRLPMLEDESQRYYNDEVNISDIAFLLWHFESQSDKRSFVSPSSLKQNTSLLDALLSMLEEAYEDAPESDKMAEFLMMNQIDSPSFSDIVPRMIFLNKQSYLTAIGANSEINQYASLLKAEGENMDEASFFFFLSEYANQMLFNQPLPFGGLYTNEWLASILGADHSAYDAAMAIGRDKLSTLYKYLGESDKYVMLFHTESKTEINVEKDSLSDKFLRDKTYWLCELVQNGDAFRCISDIAYPDEEMEEESPEQAEILRHLFESKTERQAYLSKMKEAFDKAYNGKPFFIVSDLEKANDKIREFFTEYALERHIVIPSEEDPDGNILVYMNVDEGIEIYPTHLIFGKDQVKGEGASLNYPRFTDVLTNDLFSRSFICELIRQGWIVWPEQSDEKLLKQHATFLLDYYKTEPSLN
ncbi:MAG: DUF3843 family protein [Bacteroidales bacterium]